MAKKPNTSRINGTLKARSFVHDAERKKQAKALARAGEKERGTSWWVGLSREDLAKQSVDRFPREGGEIGRGGVR